MRWRGLASASLHLPADCSASARSATCSPVRSPAGRSRFPDPCPPVDAASDVVPVPSAKRSSTGCQAPAQGAFEQLVEIDFAVNRTSTEAIELSTVGVSCPPIGPQCHAQEALMRGAAWSGLETRSDGRGGVMEHLDSGDPPRRERCVLAGLGGRAS